MTGAEADSREGLNTVDVSPKTEEQHPVVTFMDSAPVETDIYEQPSSKDALSYSDMGDASLENFLSRPVLVATDSWNQGDIITSEFNVLELLINNVGVTRKLNNFALFRFTLCIRVMLNGMPFHQGRLGISYSPLPTINGHASIDTGIPTEDYDLFRLSQYPGTKASPLNPAENEVYEMKMPFLYPENYYPISNALTSTNLKEYTQNYCSLILYSLGALDVANSETNQNASISVYAWFEDVEIGAPTVAANPVSKKTKFKQKSSVPEEEEKPDGLISSVTSAFASAAGELSGVPLVGHYMDQGAGFLNKATAALRIFGLSRPTVLTDPERFRSDPISQLALGAGNEIVDKLTIDPKQGLSLDPGLTGTGPVDTMSFAHICSNWTLVGGAPWNAGDDPDTRVFQMGVSPYFALQDSGVRSLLASCSLPGPFFKYWAGTMEYRIVIAASKYHRGRLNISYDPVGLNASVVTTNLRNTMIVDLSETTVIDFSVSWANPQAYLEVPDTFNFNPFASTGIIYNPLLFNGAVDVRVLNELTCPVSPNTVGVFVYARAGPDIEFAGPRTNLMNSWSPVPNSLSLEAVQQIQSVAEQTEEQDDEDAEQQDAREVLVPAELASSMEPFRLYGEPTPNSDLKPVAYFGEKYVSFRPLIKRYTNWQQVSNSLGTGPSFTCTTTLPGFPAPNTFPDPDQFASNGLGTLNVCNSPLMAFLRFAHVGWKGGIRWKAVANGDVFTTFTKMSASRDGDSSGTPYTTTTVARSYNATSKFASARDQPHSWGGSSATSVDRHTLEYEVPFYNNLKFCGASRDGLAPNGNGITPDTNESNMIHSITMDVGTSSASTNYYVDIYTAAAEDFDFVFFLGGFPFYFI